MVHKVLIDEQALGWIKDNEERVSKEYEMVFKVGEGQAPTGEYHAPIVGF